MADMFRQGAGANFGPLGYGGGPARGAGNLPAPSYSAPINVGEVAYQSGMGATQANPWGGDAGLRPYNTGIGGSAPAPFIPPQYGNTMGGGMAYGGINGGPGTASSAGPGLYGNTMNPQSWNAIAANTRAGQSGGVGANDLASYYARNTLAGGGGGAGASGGWTLPGGGGGINPDAGVSQYGAGLSSPAMPSSPYGGANVLNRAAPDPGPGSSPWDQQNTAYNMLYRNQISPDLGRSNLQRAADYANQSNQFRNPQAGQALGGVGSYEGQGGNVFAINPDTKASGLYQMLTPSRVAAANQIMGGDISPESQTKAAIAQINNGRYPAVYSALNNPQSTMRQMVTPLVNQFEAPAVAARPAEINAATNYGLTLNSRPNALGRYQ